MPKFNPSYPTTGVLILILFAGPFCIAVGIMGIFIVSDAWKTGQAYSFGIIVNDTTSIVTKSDSPLEYWALLTLMSVTVVVSIIVGMFSPVKVTMDYMKKLARQKKASSTHRP